MPDKPQNFKNHAKTVPIFHLFIVPVLVINFISSIVRVVRHPNVGNGIWVLASLALVLLAFMARRFALIVQDRVIRLEMRLRLRQVLPADLKPRIPEFTVNQLVSLRFAGDAELPELARKVLDEKLDDRKAIKQLIRDWQPDYLRA